MAKYSFEQKLEVVLGVVEKGLSHVAASKIIGANKSDSQKWVRLYREHGIDGLTIKHGNYSGQFKAEVIEYMHVNHLSIREAAAKFGIPAHSTVSKWERIYYEEGREALFREKRGKTRMKDGRKPKKPNIDKKVEEDLIAENQRLRMENAYLKKLNTLVQERIQRENGKK